MATMSPWLQFFAHFISGESVVVLVSVMLMVWDSVVEVTEVVVVVLAVVSV